ncbi:MAG: sigma-70 family RNA polymerase sigma factor [Actinomycetota bacterium]|nr:sigma-70 family RNA polymerase sigma factor [Actinomycetota bacterium]
MLIARPLGELGDHALVAEIRRGDERAFEALYDRYVRRITAYVKGMVHDHGRAEDVTQEIFMSALRRMRETERPIAFKPWIYEIARNACIDQHRRSKRSEEVSYDADHRLGGSDHLRLVTTQPTPDAAVDTKQQLDHLCGAFGGLTENHHEILVLRELEGMSYREIGDRMGLTRPAVESTLFRARRRLTEEYQDLASGRRCQRVQAIIGAAAEGMLGARDRRRLARHVSYCQTCRLHARREGVQDLKPGGGLRARLAALLPIPPFLRGGWGGPAATAGGWSSQASSTLAQWTVAATPALEPATAGWAKSAATVVTMAALGMGASMSSHSGAITSLLPPVRSHVVGHGSPHPARTAHPRPSATPAPGTHVGPVLGTAAASVATVPMAAPPRPGRSGGEPDRSSDRGASGRLLSTTSDGARVRGVAVPGAAVEVDVHDPARILAGPGQERGPSNPPGISVGISTPVGGTGADVSLPAVNLPVSLPTAESTGAVVAGVRSVAAPLIGG